jgi:type I restriction enzyme S subunit
MKTNTLDFDAQALREKILDLAMRGKLVPQDPNDEPASVLLEKIKTEKEELVKEKKIKKSKLLPKITDDEKPFDIPDSWEWVRLGEIGEVFAGGDKPKDFSDIKDSQHKFPIYSNGIENKGLYGFTSKARVKRPALTLSARGTIGHVEYRDTPYLPIIRLISFVPYDDSYLKCIFYFLQSNQLVEKGDGSSIPQLTVPKLKPKVIPLPPLSEQSRIAAKIAQLFALLRKVESSTQQYANLQTLLKSKVLDLAMRGKLVEQDPHDEPASVLLKKIKAEKEQLVKEGKIKKSKLLPPVTDEEKPFDIPDSWEWVRLGDIGAITSGGTPKTSEKSYWINGTIPWITPAVMAKCKDQMIFNSESVKRINNLGLEKSSAHLIPKNSLVVSSRAPIGYVNIVPFEYTTNQGCKSVSLYKDISEEFIYFALKNSVSDMNNRASGTTFKEISGTKFSQTIIPLPPLKEQTKISQKIRVLATIIHNF